MTIVATPGSTQQKSVTACVICGKSAPFDQLTAGLVDATSEQQFACFGHTWDNAKFILGWAEFAIKQSHTTAAPRKNVPDHGYIERRPLTGGDVLSWDIAHHLFARQLSGTVAILADNPNSALSALRKQWLRVTRKVQRERSATLDASLVQALTATLSHMQNLKFTSKLPYDEPADVYVLTKEQLTDIPYDCHTLYVANAVDDAQLAAAQERLLLHGGLVVIYR